MMAESVSIIDIPIDDLSVSISNVRKEIEEKTESTDRENSTIEDLAENIRNNGLIHPLIVRPTANGKYEIIAGQRRYKAMKLIGCSKITCKVVIVDDQKAEEISLYENIHRAQMGYHDKVTIYKKLYEHCNNDIKLLSKETNVTIPTLKKYLQINLSPEILAHMDAKKRNERLTTDVAVELTKVYEMGFDPLKVLDEVKSVPNEQKVEIIKKFAYSGSTDIKDLIEIRNNTVVRENKVSITNIPDVISIEGPYVYNENGNIVYIPSPLQPYILALINDYNKNGIVPSISK